jgi:hypothetical protein
VQPAVAQPGFDLDETDRLLAALEPLARACRKEKRRRESAEYADALLLLKAIRLCPTVELAERYLRGERVPVSALDQRWARAYGLL